MSEKILDFLFPGRIIIRAIVAEIANDFHIVIRGHKLRLTRIWYGGTGVERTRAEFEYYEAGKAQILDEIYFYYKGKPFIRQIFQIPLKRHDAVRGILLLNAKWLTRVWWFWAWKWFWLLFPDILDLEVKFPYCLRGHKGNTTYASILLRPNFAREVMFKRNLKCLKKSE